jgi:hypothetical protein
MKWSEESKGQMHGNLSIGVRHSDPVAMGPRGQGNSKHAGAHGWAPLEFGVLAAFADARDMWQGLILDILDVLRSAG